MPGDSPMTERELIDQLCDLRPEWTERRMEIHEADIYYVDGATLGHELMSAILGGRDEPWMRAACLVIERALEVGTEDTKGLVVVGLFEAMQGPAYHHAGDPEIMQGWLLRRSREAWADLIEGWTGEGIRTVEAWRRVVVNGPRHLIELDSPALSFRISTEPGGAPPLTWRAGGATGAFVPTADEAKRITDVVQPLVARRILARPAGEQFTRTATLVVDGAQGRAEIVFGARTDDGYVADDGTRRFVIDLDALVERWRWITTR